ncbi:WapI family immunity protein [Nonomuraea sp. NPDC002799]
MDSIEIVIGRSKQADHVAIRVVGRMHPGATDFWDGNWLTSPVLVHVGGFNAKIDAGLRIEELRDFRVDLQRIYAEAQGRAVLSSMEHWVELIVECPVRGRRLGSDRHSGDR